MIFSFFIRRSFSNICTQISFSEDHAEKFENNKMLRFLICSLIEGRLIEILNGLNVEIPKGLGRDGWAGG